MQHIDRESMRQHDKAVDGLVELVTGLAKATVLIFISIIIVFVTLNLICKPENNRPKPSARFELK
jgi:hypothetical protein